MLSRIPKSTLVPLAFASVYLFWGSTYAGIHIAGVGGAVLLCGGDDRGLTRTIKG